MTAHIVFQISFFLIVYVVSSSLYYLFLISKGKSSMTFSFDFFS